MHKELKIYFATGHVESSDGIIIPDNYSARRGIPEYMDLCIIKLKSKPRAYAYLGNIVSGVQSPYMVGLARPKDFCPRAFPLYLYKIPLQSFDPNKCQDQYNRESKLCTQINANIKWTKGDSGKFRCLNNLKS